MTCTDSFIRQHLSVLLIDDTTNLHVSIADSIINPPTKSLLVTIPISIPLPGLSVYFCFLVRRPCQRKY